MSSASRRDATTSRPRPTQSNLRSRLAIVGLAVLLGLLTAFTLPASAEQTRDRTDRKTSTDVVTDQRPDRDLEVLSLACRIVDHAVDHASDQVSDEPSDRTTDRLAEATTDPVAAPAPSPTRIHIGCRWRPAQHPAAAGYQLWRIVDRGEREMVARGGLDMTGARDVVSAKSHLVRYAVIAVNEHGRRVGQSRVVEIRLHDDRPDDRPARLRRHNVR